MSNFLFLTSFCNLKKFTLIYQKIAKLYLLINKFLFIKFNCFKYKAQFIIRLKSIK